MDKRVEKIIRRYEGMPGAVISVLEDIQETEGYLPKDILEHVSEKMNVPLSQLFSMATFYSAF